ncbi:MAG: hypothetical protein ACRD5G_04425 [Candidatus Acidiferrales bacterium]
MSEVDALFLVLAALYLIQCIHWVAEEAFLFRQTWLGRWRPAALAVHLSGLHRKALMASPLPPLGGVLVCSPVERAAPFALAPEGVVLPGGEKLRYEEFALRTPQSPQLRLNGTHAVRFVSAVAARHWATILRKLAKQAVEQRASTIERAVEAMLDSERIAQDVARCRAHAALLRWHCNVLFVFLFVLAPVAVWLRGLAFTWPVLLAALLVQMWVIAWLFRRAHLRVQAEDSETRFTATATMLLSPMAAVRAGDLLLLDLLSCYHPAAVARVLCRSERFEALAARSLREVFFPLPSSNFADDDSGWTEWWDAKWREALRRFVARHVEQGERFLAAPSAQQDCQSYCPRCWNQYLSHARECADCDGLPLRPLPHIAPDAGSQVSASLEP